MTGDEFRAIRTGLGLTQTQLGDFLGFGRMHITQIESGGKTITRPVELCMIAARAGAYTDILRNAK